MSKRGRKPLSAPPAQEIEQALREGGSVNAAAKIIGVSRLTLVKWIERGEIDGLDSDGVSDALQNGIKRKLTKAVNTDGHLTEADLDDPGSLLREHGLREDDYEIIKVDLASRENSSVKDPRVVKSIAVTAVPKTEIPNPAQAGEKTVFRAQPKRRKKSEDCRTFVVLGDEQAPNGLDEDLHKVVCQWLRDEQPDELIHIGDLGDFESVSSYDQLNPVEWGNSVQDCIDSSYRILGNYMANLPKGTRARYLIGNHEVRLQKYLLKQAKELWGVSRANEAKSVLDLDYLLRLDELGVELIGNDLGTYPHPQIEIVPNKLIAIHGDVARRHSGSSPHAASNGMSCGVIHGHTHRAAVVSKTVRSPQKSYQLQSAEIGCLCKTNGLGYTSARTTDWQQGFATVSVWDDGHYQIDLASYQNGVLVWRGKRWSLSDIE